MFLCMVCIRTYQCAVVWAAMENSAAVIGEMFVGMV